MSGYLQRLIAKTFPLEQAIRPRSVALFGEPISGPEWHARSMPAESAQTQQPVASPGVGRSHRDEVGTERAAEPLHAETVSNPTPGVPPIEPGRAPVEASRATPVLTTYGESEVRGPLPESARRERPAISASTVAPPFQPRRVDGLERSPDSSGDMGSQAEAAPARVNTSPRALLSMSDEPSAIKPTLPVRQAAERSTTSAPPAISALPAISTPPEISVPAVVGSRRDPGKAADAPATYKTGNRAEEPSTTMPDARPRPLHQTRSVGTAREPDPQPQTESVSANIMGQPPRLQTPHSESVLSAPTALGRALRRNARASEPEPNTVHVTIGTLEVTADRSAPATSIQKAPAKARAPRMSLEDYLRLRGDRGRG